MSPNVHPMPAKERDLQVLKQPSRPCETVEEKLNQLLAGQEALSRVILEHDAWITSVRSRLSRAIRWGGPIVVGLLARSETVPPWLRAIWDALLGGGQ